MSPKCHTGFSFHLSHKMSLGCEEGSREGWVKGKQCRKKVSRRLTDPVHIPRHFLLSDGQGLLGAQRKFFL